MFGLRQLACLAAAVACLVVAVAGARAGSAPADGIVEVKLGLNSMSNTDRANLWKLVDEYATVDALQEFCGTNLNLQRRAWRAVASCVETASLKRVFSAFRTKKAEYLKAWETLHGEPEKKKLVCERFKGKLGQYSKVMSGQIAEAATMCRNCFFC
jgi:hypothetical protein